MQKNIRTPKTEETNNKDQLNELLHIQEEVRFLLSSLIQWENVQEYQNMLFFQSLVLTVLSTICINSRKKLLRSYRILYHL